MSEPRGTRDKLDKRKNRFAYFQNKNRLDGPAHRIVTKTVHKTLPMGGGGPGGGWVEGYRGGGGPGVGDVGGLFDMKLTLSV